MSGDVPLMLSVSMLKNKIPVRGRKPACYSLRNGLLEVLVEKQNPRKGTETCYRSSPEHLNCVDKLKNKIPVRGRKLCF